MGETNCSKCSIIVTLKFESSPSLATNNVNNLVIAKNIQKMHLFDPSHVCDSQLEPEFDPTIDNAALCVRINLRKGRHLVRRENYLAKPALASVCDVFEIYKETVLAECLFAEDP